MRRSSLVLWFALACARASALDLSGLDVTVYGPCLRAGEGWMLREEVARYGSYHAYRFESPSGLQQFLVFSSQELTTLSGKQLRLLGRERTVEYGRQVTLDVYGECR